MKRMFVIGLLTIAATSIATDRGKSANAGANSKAEQEIRQVEGKRREALLRSNTTALDESNAIADFVT